MNALTCSKELREQELIFLVRIMELYWMRFKFGLMKRSLQMK